MNKECRSQIEPHLQLGEQLVAVCECELAPGVPDQPLWLTQPPQESDLERRIKARLPGAVQRFLQHSPPRPISRAERITGGVADTLEGAERAINNGISRTMHGEGLHGGWESQAGEFLATHYTATHTPASQLAVAFTGRRVLVLADRAKLWQLKRSYEPQWEAPRTAVAGVRANPKGVVQRGRFELVFADGSWIALVASVPTHAEPFAAQAGS
ncbi:hypothetical protein OG746_13630 [Streptomyces sp. NBC_01016]|uniref:hypothetical protein n=1 Tax=Streptomyces sp. NBC_01016 TaxID=2903720 RepID=UPI0022595958|nr:hypothetical protein [Streptomyces sp. NBC_01016]MCX4829771.1 hypothetical protein [Streptomyces sp. NBC_01016]